MLAKARPEYDLRWNVALGVEVDARPFAKSTLQVLRAQSVLKERMHQIFEASLAYARESGCLKKCKLRAVLDATHSMGRGADTDTRKLLADGIRQLMRALTRAEGRDAAVWAEEQVEAVRRA